MSLRVVEKAISRLIEDDLVGRSLEISWHAGEPLVVQPAFYRDAFCLVERLLGPDVAVKHLIQTNGVLISDRWRDILSRKDVSVGVSLDGPEDIHNKQRVDRAKRGTFDATMKGISRLTEWGLPITVIAVLTENSLDRPKDLFEFFHLIGAKNVCFNIEEKDGVHRDVSYSSGGLSMRAKFFFRRYYDLLREHQFPHWVREFDNAFNAVLASNLERPRNALTTPLRSINVMHDGSFSTFCPELLGASTEKYGQFVFGNVEATSFKVALESDKFKRAYADIWKGVQLCAESCSYFGVCGGGAPSNKLAENGTFISSETMHCLANVKILIDLALDVVEAEM